MRAAEKLGRFNTPYGYPNDPVNKQDTTGQWAGAAIRLIGWVIKALSKGKKGNTRLSNGRKHQRIAGAQATANSLVKRNYDLYEITYVQSGRTMTYKYGITSVPLGGRQREMVRACEKDKRKSGPCQWQSHGTRPTAYRARLWEEQKLNDYALRNGGKCPLWHQGKRVCK
jgi:hypothetical protein